MNNRHIAKKSSRPLVARMVAYALSVGLAGAIGCADLGPQDDEWVDDEIGETSQAIGGCVSNSEYNWWSDECSEGCADACGDTGPFDSQATSCANDCYLLCMGGLQTCDGQVGADPQTPDGF